MSRPKPRVMIGARGDTGILMAKGLEPSSVDRAYQVWLWRGGQRVTVGLLSVDEHGWGVLTLWPEQPISLFQQVWVTEEQAEESAGSTSRLPKNSRRNCPEKGVTEIK